MKSFFFYLLVFSTSCFAQWKDDPVFSLGTRYYFLAFSVFVPVESGCRIESANTGQNDLMTIHFSTGDKINALITLSYFKTDKIADSLQTIFDAQEKYLDLPEGTQKLDDQPYGKMMVTKEHHKRYSATDAFLYCGTDDELMRRQKSAQIAGLVATTIIANLITVPLGYAVIPTGAALREMPEPVRQCRYIVSHLETVDDSSNTILSILLTTNEINSKYSYFMNALIASIHEGTDSIQIEKPYIQFGSTLSAVRMTDGSFGKGSIERLDSEYVYFRKYDSRTTVKLPRRKVRWYSIGQDTAYLNR